MVDDEPRKQGAGIIILVAIIIAVAISYAGTSIYYKQVMDSQSADFARQLSEAKSQPAPTAAPTTPEVVVKEVVTQVKTGVTCEECHGEIKSHHLANITKLSTALGKTPRTCNTCHASTTHGIHKLLMEQKKLDCMACHGFEPGKPPIPNLRPGDIVVCQQCHYEGEYITIHVTKGSGSCATCHLGGAVQIHKPVMRDINALLSTQ